MSPGATASRWLFVVSTERKESKGRNPMRRHYNALLLLLLPLAVSSVAGAITPEQLEAIVKRLEERVTAQDSKIAAQNKEIVQLRAQLSDKGTSKARADEIRQIIKELKVDAGQRTFPSWLENFTLFGDLRLRYHYSRDSSGKRDDSKGRFRLRVGVKKTWMEKQMETGFRLASGSSDDPASTNQTFDDSFSEKKVWIDLAYAKHSPKAIKGFTIIGGKMKNPFVHTNMIWDSDVNPEGVWAIYAYPGCGSFEPFVGMGVFGVENTSSERDARLHAYQVGFNWKVVKDVKWTSALSYYDYDNYERHAKATSGNTGTTTLLTAEEFETINLTNKVSWKAFGFPMSAYVDLAHNCANELGGQSDAFAVGYKIGKNKKKGDWSAKYKYALIQANSTPGRFNDSDFGHSNRKGHQLGFAYNITDYLSAGLNLFCTRPVSAHSSGTDQFLVLGDLIWKF